MRGIILVGLLLFCSGFVNSEVTAYGEQSDTRETSVSAAQDERKVELNSADRAALESLPGVGPRTAELIIEYRKEHGGFDKVEDLMNVKGIGERTFLRLRELVQISDAVSR